MIDGRDNVDCSTVTGHRLWWLRNWLFLFLPPSCTREGNVFYMRLSVCLSTPGGEPPSPSHNTSTGPRSQSRSGWRGTQDTPMSIVDGGTPGTPLSRLDGVTPHQEWMGDPPSIRTGWATPPPPPPWDSSRVSTCFMAGSMPLAFTQRDFLVFFHYCVLDLNNTKTRRYFRVTTL